MDWEEREIEWSLGILFKWRHRIMLALVIPAKKSKGSCQGG
jgi:hypothetical protein